MLWKCSAHCPFDIRHNTSLNDFPSSPVPLSLSYPTVSAAAAAGIEGVISTIIISSTTTTTTLYTEVVVAALQQQFGSS